MSFDWQHVVLLPLVEPVFQNWLYRVVYAVIHMLDIPFAFYLDHVNIPFFEYLCKFLKSSCISFPLSLQTLLLLSDHFLEFRDLGVFLIIFFGFLILLTSLYSFLSGVLSLTLFLKPPFLFYVLKLSLDLFNI